MMISHDHVLWMNSSSLVVSLASILRISPACLTQITEPRVRAVMHELAYNLESFNPAFTAVLLKVQRTIGVSNYVARDVALKHLIQPLAGEYGMHNNEPQGWFDWWGADVRLNMCGWWIG